MNDIYWVWKQARVPVLLRRSEGLPRLRLPFATNNRAWIRNGRRSNIAWDGERRYWEFPRKWFSDMVNRCLDRFGQVYIIQPYREQEKCAPACWHALGHECQCSCMGVNHGAGDSGGWTIVSDAFATRWRDRSIACRLLTKLR